jgi:hypothetical protein
VLLYQRRVFYEAEKNICEKIARMYAKFKIRRLKIINQFDVLTPM